MLGYYSSAYMIGPSGAWGILQILIQVQAESPHRCSGRNAHLAGIPKANLQKALNLNLNH